MKQLAITGAAALLLYVGVPGGAFAQVNATVGGTVSDSTGAVIPSAQVTAKNVKTGIVTTRMTNDTGNYDFPSLQPGLYTLTVTFQGFQTAVFNNLDLGQGQQVRQNFTLQPAGGAQAVEVVADANTALATTAATVGTVLTDRLVASLPLLNRNALNLVSTTPGVVMIRNAFGEVANLSGTQTGQVNTTRDGLETNDGRYNDSNGAYSGIFTSPDLVEEVRVNTNSVDAALGRGSSQVQMMTRSGSNAYHGSLFYTNNNSAFNANQWFDNLVGQQKGYLNRNQYGGRVGGPIKKNKAFFFVLVDNQRYLDKQTVTSVVLTEPARQGIFRYLTVDSAGGAPRRNGNALSASPSVSLDGRVLTADSKGAPLFLNSFNLFTDVRDPNRTRIDPVWFASQYLKRMPLPNDYTVGDGLNTAGFRWRRPQDGTDGATGVSPNSNRDHLTMRFDYQVNDRNRVTFTMSREKDYGVTGQTGLPGYPGGFFGDVQRLPGFYTASWSSTISSTTLNEFRFGYKRDAFFGTSPFDKGCCWNGAKETDRTESAKDAIASFPSVDGKLMIIAPGGSLGINGVLGGPLGIGSYAPYGVASPRQGISPFRQFADTLTMIKGSHSFQAGFELDRAFSKQSNSGGQQTTRPTVTLGIGNIPVPSTFTTTTFRGLSPNDLPSAQDLLANLAGSVANIQEQFFINSPTQQQWSDYRTTILFSRELHQNDWALFFKDNWKVTKNLTLILGLRYDKYGTPYDALGLGGRFTGGQAGLFGISGTNFANAQWAPYAKGGQLTTTEFVGKDSANPDKLIFGNDWKDFAPSFAFAYSVPWFKSSTVIRGGYGINYAGAVDFLSYSGNIANLPGQTYNTTFTPATYLDLTGLNPTVVPLSTNNTVPFSPVSLTTRAGNIVGYADDRKTPYIQSFNLSVQRELAPSTTLDLSWVGNKGSRLWSNTQINETNIFENGLLDAFNVTRAGGNAPLFDRILNGLNVPGVGVVNGTTLTGSQAFRRFINTNQFFANGEVARFADFLNTTSLITGQNGGLLRNGNLPENFIVANPQFAQVGLAGNNSNSTYHSLQSVLTHRYSNGFSGQFSYVWSKSLGDTAVLGLRDPRDRKLSKGILSNNRTHILKFSGAYELPFGRKGMVARSVPGWIDQMIGGFNLGSGISWVSGAPLTFTTNRATIGFRTSGGALGTLGTADLVGAFQPGHVQVGNGFVQYFPGLSVSKSPPLPNFGGDPTLPGRFSNQVLVDTNGNIVLKNPEPGSFGNTAVDLPGLTGPSTLGFDLSLAKRVRIREGINLTFRGDAINLLNRPIWGTPITDINSASFGRITMATGNRTVTLNARVDF